MRFEIDIPSCGHPNQIKEISKLKNHLIQMTAWAGWLDGRWINELTDKESTWYTEIWYTFNNGARETCLKLAARDLGLTGWLTEEKNE